MSNAATAVKGRKNMGIVVAVIGTIIGLAALYVVLAHLGGRSVQFVSDDRTAFIVLAVIGMVMCAFGIQTISNSTGWMSPGAFIGAAIGILILIAFVLALLNRPMFLFANYRSGFIALAFAILIKWSVPTISLIYSLVAKS
jgi:hypothetical protein